MKVEIGNLKAVKDLDVASRIPRVKLTNYSLLKDQLLVTDFLH